MKTAVRGLLLLLAVAALLLLGVLVYWEYSPSPDDAAGQLWLAGSFDLYSLEPRYDPAWPGEQFHGWRSLGKITVSDGTTRRKLLRALRKALREGGYSAKCFDPRHGIEWTRNGKSSYLLICFQCSNAEFIRDGEWVGKRPGDYLPIARDIEPIFDEVLARADIPLAKKKRGQ